MGYFLTFKTTENTFNILFTVFEYLMTGFFIELYFQEDKLDFVNLAAGYKYSRKIILA
jgi:hypothetical protein